MPATLIKNIGELVTFEPLVKSARIQAQNNTDIGSLNDAWVLLKNGKVEDLGSSPVPVVADAQIIDAQGGLVMPGLIDSHTHPLFAGNRANEFAMRLDGKTYQDIAAMGGGIKRTVKASRDAQDAELLALLQMRMERALAHGITTMEVKSGYGLSVEEELRQLRLISTLKKKVPVHLYVTCLALHDNVGPQSKETYIEDCRKNLLPLVAKESIAHAVDAFIEQGYYQVGELEQYMLTAKDLGFEIRLHADEFSDAGAAKAAARWGAKSADHLQFASSEGIRDMAEKGVVATILPGTSLYTKIPYTDARKFIGAGCPVAIATDFNPGSCPLSNLPFLASIGALHCHFNAAQALSAITRVAAHSLSLGQRKGALAPGFDGDLIIHHLKTKEEFLADFGQTKPREIWVGGKKVS